MTFVQLHTITYVDPTKTKVSTQPTSLEQVPLRPVTRVKTPAYFTEDRTKPLTRKQALFVEYYRRGLSPKNAAISAGYSPSVAENASTEILQHPRVQEEIARRDAEFFESLGYDDPNWAIRKIVAIAASNPADIIDIQEDGTYKVDLKKANREMLYAIKKIGYDIEGRPEVEFESKLKALESLQKIKMIQQEQKNGSSNGLLTISALDSIVQKVTNNNVQVNIIASPESKCLPTSVTVVPAIESADSKCLPVSVGDSDSKENSSQ